MRMSKLTAQRPADLLKDWVEKEELLQITLLCSSTLEMEL